MPGRGQDERPRRRLIADAVPTQSHALRGVGFEQKAGHLLSVLGNARQLPGELEEFHETHPLAEILTPLPGVGPRTVIEFLRTVSRAGA